MWLTLQHLWNGQVCHPIQSSPGMGNRYLPINITQTLNNAIHTNMVLGNGDPIEWFIARTNMVHRCSGREHLSAQSMAITLSARPSEITTQFSASERWEINAGPVSDIPWVNSKTFNICTRFERKLAEYHLDIYRLKEWINWLTVRREQGYTCDVLKSRGWGWRAGASETRDLWDWLHPHFLFSGTVASDHR